GRYGARRRGHPRPVRVTPGNRNSRSGRVSSRLSPPLSRYGIHTSLFLQVTQGISTESPLPLWERDRVRGLAPAGADESVSSQHTVNSNGASTCASHRAS